MSSEVAKLAQRQPAEARQEPATNIPNAVEQIMAGLKEAISSMKADDVSVELSASQERDKSHARFTLRAYRRGQQVVNIDENKEG